MPNQTVRRCPVCGSDEVKTTVRKSIVVCRCRRCDAIWHVLADRETTAA
jgi:ribosomal protein L37AE/L43A